jgi:hypothetical protein
MKGLPQRLGVTVGVTAARTGAARASAVTGIGDRWRPRQRAQAGAVPPGGGTTD